MFYPINLKIDDMNIIIIGGGKVAYRKCINFLAFNKKVRVISKDFIEEFEGLKDCIDTIKDNYDEKYIKDAFVVVAATNNDDVNREIGLYCREHGKLVNVVDNANLSNFTVPSFVKRGDLLLSVSTGGKSPSLSSKIRKDLEEVYDESYEEYVSLLGEARKNIIKNTEDVKERRNKLNALLNFSFDELRQIK
ncbi:precorrin-2 dehydrogenase/sirohydrochlorin ferrochelatase family protein [Terrisporobacter mayombei]|uniref:precorrin-2 dehydrogenase/sirohydrochlorin ferrochelatase family protein n=1 Tax=Terrisporobacter mayombei TaxID=1541 RepID=UPI002657DD35|nr:bifunctional precorrin-2 dehydrogenase/sirohydrochlorin ferrochelatase [Terrisporobacter mayombei]MCC3671025.1 bifunctional precorrin-2 dehydrogenase/sirohydrochlorin ferrochelatase [Terrisporobacter mayombei]